MSSSHPALSFDINWQVHISKLKQNTRYGGTRKTFMPLIGMGEPKTGLWTRKTGMELELPKKDMTRIWATQTGAQVSLSWGTYVVTRADAEVTTKDVDRPQCDSVSVEVDQT